ncbi:ATP-binding protein [Amycolatopsis magusensis]|uniref:ATP-binding protein n=1 Tax=Amycolatopsis magusensis TaxID=882444 RepID=UPI0024A9B676|nr:tetratricopeptide repeat protein [Amycolatopsis magusensis]MDI5981121.1 tetratricopeptide repeat protein [Amycolatopsis magusensis]
MHSEPIRTAADLGRDLKRWTRRRPSGPVKVATLAKRLNLSQSTLYAYLAGTTLPPAEVFDDLLDELGVPAGERRRLCDARDALHGARGRAVAVPRELPADLAGFTGRDAELATLDAVRTDPSGVRISVISGAAGVGKTALAVRWSHRVAERFPDGCLYADLQGYSPVEPRRAADVLGRFLRSLGVPGDHVPDDEQERAARFRSRLAGQRVLLVLDNALDADQVRPLLPGGPDCFVVLTSRTDLAGLLVEPGARRVELRPLELDDGVALLRTHLGPRAEEAPDALRSLAEQCGGLPLALRIVAAQAAGRPVTELVAELADQGTDLLDVGDPGTAIGTVFSWSLRHLDARAVADFHSFGRHPARDIDLPAAAALLGTDVRDAGKRIDRLVRAHLVQRSATGRLDMHDLVRAYARERASGDDTASARLVDHFVDAAGAAMDVLLPSGPVVGADAGAARALVDAEWHNLLAVLAFTARQGWVERTGRLAAVLSRHLDQGGRHRDALTVLGHALEASRLAGDLAAEGAALYDLGVAHLRLGEHEEARKLHDQALAVCRAGGDRHGEAGALNNLGNLYERLGRYEEAIEHYRAALPLVRELDLRRGRAVLLTNLGVVHTRLGEYEQALRDGQEALEIFRELGDLGGAARTLGNLGEVHHLSGRDAFGHYDEALALATEVGAHSIRTEVLNHLGAAHLASGATEQARSSHTAALDLARATGDRYEEARALEGLGSAACAAGQDPVCPWREAAELYRRMGLPEADRVEALLGQR